MIIHPESKLKEFWDLYMLVLTVACALIIPLQIALHVPFHSSLLWFESLLSISFGIDIVLHFFTGFRFENRIILDPRRIAVHYLRSWFILDLIAALPFFLIHGTDAAEATQLLRVIRFLQIHRLLKLLRVNEVFSQFQRKHALNPGLFRLGYFVLLISLITHMLACGWILLDGITDETDPVTIYIKALYFTVTTLASVGYGDITPHNNIQRIFALGLMMIGVGSYGFVIGNMASFLANRDIVRANYFKKLEEVTAFLRYRAIPSDLRSQILAYYDHVWESRMGQDEAELLSDLPQSLRVDIALAMRKDLIQKVPFFREASEDLLRDIVMALRPAAYIPGSFIIREGEMGDCMYIVSSGIVEIVSRDGSQVFTELTEGSFLGEMALIYKTERTASARARGYCDLYVLKKRDFDFILSRYPAFASHIMKVAEERRREAASR